jgi:chromosome partitioning protein
MSPKSMRPERTRVIATINLKGGVGKTTTTVALAEFLAAEHGYRVLVVDLDPQTNASVVLMGEKGWKAADQAGQTLATLFHAALDSEQPEFDLDAAIQRGVSSVAAVGTADLLPSSPKLIDLQDRLIQVPAGKFHAGNPTDVLRKALAPVLDARTYDYILIDCPPSMGIITLNGLRIAHGYLIPTIPDYMSSNGIPQVQKRVREYATEAGTSIAEVGILLTKYRAASDVHQLHVRLLRTDAALPEVFRTVIPEANQIAAAAEYNTCATLRQKYGQEHYKAFHAFTGEFVSAVERVAA